MEDFIIFFCLVAVLPFLFLLWIIYGYPVYAMLKSERIELRKKEIELKLKQLNSSKNNKPKGI